MLDPVALAIFLLMVYFLCLVVAYMLLITPGRRNEGMLLLLGSGILPLASTLTLVGEVERLSSAVIRFILEEPLALLLVVAASWLLLYSLLYSLLRSVMGFSKGLSTVTSAVAAAYGAVQLPAILSTLLVSLTGFTGLGMVAAVLAIHFLVSAWILKASRKSR